MTNHLDLASTVADATELSSSDAKAAVDAVVNGIAASLARGESVRLPGFGTFETRERSARTGRNPQTGAEIQIAATTVPAFKPAAQLKRTVAGD